MIPGLPAPCLQLSLCSPCAWDAPGPAWLVPLSWLSVVSPGLSLVALLPGPLPVARHSMCGLCLSPSPGGPSGADLSHPCTPISMRLAPGGQGHLLKGEWTSS